MACVLLWHSLFSTTTHAHTVKMAEDRRARWKALESNPEVLTKFAHLMGLKKDWGFCDIYGLDEELDWVPQPCRAVVFLFPSRRKTATGEEAVAHTSVEGGSSDASPSCGPNRIALILFKGNAFYITQIKELGNACGTIAVIHSIANNRDLLEKGALDNYVNSVKNATPLARGNALNEVIVDKVEFHFIAFTEIDGHCYELDGCNTAGPVDHGELGEQSLLKAAAVVIKKNYISVNPDMLGFSMMGLVQQ